MPLLNGLRTQITIDVADKVFADTIIKQRAIFTSLTHTQLPTGECAAVIGLTVRSFASEGGKHGESLADKGVADRFLTLVADNNCVVDATTGEILAVRGKETNKDWQAQLDAFEQDVMLQGDFFELLRENQAVKIGDMIRLHIAQADKMGRFA